MKVRVFQVSPSENKQMATLDLQQEVRLADIVKLYPILYDKTSEGYKEKDAVENAWSAVANQIDFVENSEKAKDLFTTLKRKYQRKKRELREVNTSATSKEAISKAENAYAAYRFLSWIDDYFTCRRGKNNLSKSQSTQSYSEYETVNEDNVADEKVFALSNQTDLSKNLHTKRGQSQALSAEDTSFSDMQDSCAQVSRKRYREEESSEDLFCKSLAADLKDLPPYERCVAKNQISNILFKLQMSVMADQQHRFSEDHSL